MRLRNIWAIFHARNMEFVRDRGSFIWNMILPIFFIFALSFAFGRDNNRIFDIGLYGTGSDHAILQSEYIDSIPYEDFEIAKTRLARHQIALLLDLNTNTYYVNPLSSESKVVAELFANFEDTRWQLQTIEGEAIRYIDWVVPGVLAMNMMFSGFFGVGFVIVRYRKNGVLKRFRATPLRPVEFVTAQIGSRLLIVVLNFTAVYIGTNFLLNFVMHGSYLTLLLLAVVSVTCVISLALIFASRIKSEELAGGLLNVAIWPMMLFSGLFFSLDGAAPFLKTLSKIFPLTHFLEGARAVMLDGASFVEVLPNFGVLVGMTFLFLIVASLLFRWE